MRTELIGGPRCGEVVDISEQYSEYRVLAPMPFPMLAEPVQAATHPYLYGTYRYDHTVQRRCGFAVRVFVWCGWGS